jgi:hypothetical protein
VTQETELKELVRLGLEQLRRGESLDLDDASLAKFFDEAKARARKRLAQKRASLTRRKRTAGYPIVVSARILSAIRSAT